MMHIHKLFHVKRGNKIHCRTNEIGTARRVMQEFPGSHVQATPYLLEMMNDSFKRIAKVIGGVHTIISHNRQDDGTYAVTFIRKKSLKVEYGIIRLIGKTLTYQKMRTRSPINIQYLAQGHIRVHKAEA